MNGSNSDDNSEKTETKTNTTKLLSNTEYNEAVEVANAEEVRTPSPHPSSSVPVRRPSLQRKDAVMSDDHNDLDEDIAHISEDKSVVIHAPQLGSNDVDSPPVKMIRKRGKHALEKPSFDSAETSTITLDDMHDDESNAPNSNDDDLHGIPEGSTPPSIQSNTTSHTTLGALGAVGLPLGTRGGAGSDQSENSNEEDDDEDDDDDEDVQGAPVEGPQVCHSSTPLPGPYSHDYSDSDSSSDSSPIISPRLAGPKSSTVGYCNEDRTGVGGWVRSTSSHSHPSSRGSVMSFLEELRILSLTSWQYEKYKRQKCEGTMKETYEPYLNTPPVTYNPVDYEHLVVSSDIKELFQHITRYTPQNIELEYKLKPFIPDFIPAVGDIDAFIKVPRPDGKEDSIGLTVLDEPCARQSDPSVLDLQLRALSKQTSAKPKLVKKVESAEKNVKAIEKWIKDISDLHRAKPPPTVHYNKPMPDIDSLMQEWPADFEELLKEVVLPTADLDCDLSSYVDIICGILDIPVYKSSVQSLHVLFTLYSAFKNSQHFRSLAEENNMDNSFKETEESDHLVI